MAVQICGDRQAVASPGCHVDADGLTHETPLTVHRSPFTSPAQRLPERVVQEDADLLTSADPSPSATSTRRATGTSPAPLPACEPGSIWPRPGGRH
jgi:hypothetical protein